MLSLNETRRQVRNLSVKSRPLWQEILTISVTSNGYPDQIRERVLECIRANDDQGLLKLAVDLSSQVYEDHAVHYRMHQLSALIRKYPSLNLPDVSPEDNAWLVFRNAEFRCKWTNRKLSALARYNSGREAPAFHMMREYINYVLRDKADVDVDGLGPTPNYQRIYSLSSFTGGASMGVNGNATNIFRKLNAATGGGWTVSPSAFLHVCEAFWAHAQIREYVLSLSPDTFKAGFVCYDRSEFYRLLDKLCERVRNNKIAFVIKDATIRRIVANEPTCNTVPLKGVDLELRSKLRNAGIDLTEQEPNQLMAFIGSDQWESDDPYCTIDLRSASGMLSYLLVKELLPPEWFELLDSLRSEYYVFPNGHVGRYESFASMGNGSVFPLQTLVFASVCHTAYRECGIKPDFRVYGDDIIVRRSVFDRVISLLRFLGFKPNPKKTFSEGPFRESCGADFHSGVNVRPVNLDHEISSLEQIFGFHNQSLRRGGLQELYFREVRTMLRSKVPKPLRFVVPYDPLRLLPQGLSKGVAETYDCAFWAPMDVVMGSSTCFWNRDTWSWGFTALQAEPTEDILLDDERETSAYAFASLQAALLGSSSSSPFTLRYARRFQVVRLNKRVNWDGASFSKIRVFTAPWEVKITNSMARTLMGDDLVNRALGKQPW
ncbi:TPA_asm: RNA-directed RNA polymerase [ssRNA phage SRR6960551_13]|uniref:RNA-directed RNA polymerase n=1 Tax=ssRNA phage SRR6960551_13 TaxID=2786551 RepID=A0A8S5L4Z0_9VIRU|nr:RNA-directed RNA polymerase [ssRNA phage SRR6960551_13]DAD52611.1 TPA_asm: RNA-directed RNA polymerase [ssRNA phage SRR6960551_13]